MADQVNVFWFRRDLRLDDNVGFYEALSGDLPVLPIFIFDKEILDKLPEDDARVTFIFEELQRMRKQLQDEVGSSLAMYYGTPDDIWKKILNDHGVNAVYTNRDYEPYAKERDASIEELLEEHDIKFHTFKDQVIFEKSEVVKNDGDPYVVYTPYKNKWLERFQEEHKDADGLRIYYTSSILENCIQNSRLPNLTLSDMGFQKSSIEVPEYDVTPTTIEEYENTRNFPAKEGTTRLGVYLRFGVASPRKMIKKGLQSNNKVFLSELIWREFFMQILFHFPETKDKAF